MLDRSRFLLRRKRGSLFSTSRSKLISVILTFVFFSLIAGFIFILLAFAWYSRDLPKPDKVQRSSGLSTVIYDRNNKPLYDIFKDQNRIAVDINDIPKYLKEATIAIEDKNFYKHQGFSFTGIIRAFINTILFRKLEGGSTLTQQLVKNALLTSERTVPRKIKEFVLSVEIERRYSKDQILQMYFNEAPYGGTAWGIEVASKTYFGKPVKDLTITESVILAGIPQRPSYYSPYTGEPKAYIARAENVLRRMREDGYIDKSQEEETKKQLPQVVFNEPGSLLKAPHFVMYVKEQLNEKFGEKLVEEGGLKVYTTLDIDLQDEAQKIVTAEVDNAKSLKVGNGAVVVLDPKSGDILSMVGSKDYFAGDYDGNVNVTLSLRQPGSALKPITYAAAFKKGFTPSSLIMDTQTHFPSGIAGKDYLPQNYDLKFRGPVQLRYALGNSINVAAVKLLAYTGVSEMLKTAYDMGLTTLEPTKENVNRFGLSITLGGGEVRLLELSSSYGVFATGGMLYEPLSILKVVDSKGKVLFEHKKPKGKKVLDSDISFLISDILSDNNARLEVFGPKSWLNIPGKKVAVKTGTTDDKRDNWTVGYTPSVVVGVWVGNNDNSTMDPKLATGVSGAAPIWNKVMQKALAKMQAEDFIKSDNIVELEIDAFLGGLPKDPHSRRKEFFKKGTEPTEPSSIYKTLKLSKNSQKLANPIEIIQGNYDTKEFYVFEEKDPVSTDGKNRFQEGINEYLSKISDPLYHPPSETSSANSDDIIISLIEPINQKKYDTNDIRIKAKAFSAKSISKLEVRVDSTLIKTTSGSELDEVFHLDDGVKVIDITAQDESGKTAQTSATIGVKTEIVPTPTP